MRSLIEPPGFWLSSLMNRRQRPVSNLVQLDHRRLADQVEHRAVGRAQARHAVALCGRAFRRGGHRSHSFDGRGIF